MVQPPDIADSGRGSLFSAPYSAGRATDPRIATRVDTALGDAETVLSLDDGSATYEENGRAVTAIVADDEARGRRPQAASPAQVVDPRWLPFDDDSFDAVTAIGTLERWGEVNVLLREALRVARGPVVILGFDLTHLAAWQRDYLAPLLAVALRNSTPPNELAPMLGRRTRIDALRTPADCVDGFIDAFWVRPHALLDPNVRAAQPSWQLAGEDAEAAIVERLRTDIESGEWEEQYGHLRSHADYDGALRLLTARG